MGAGRGGRVCPHVAPWKVSSTQQLSLRAVVPKNRRHSSICARWPQPDERLCLPRGTLQARGATAATGASLEGRGTLAVAAGAEEVWPL